MGLNVGLVTGNRNRYNNHATHQNLMIISI